MHIKRNGKASEVNGSTCPTKDVEKGHLKHKIDVQYEKSVIIQHHATNNNSSSTQFYFSQY